MGEPNGRRRLDVPAVLRALRRRADLSQRELAVRSGVPAATLGRLEAGLADDPKLRTVERLVRGAGARLAVMDLDGTEPVGLETDRWRDGSGRRYPAHLDPAPETLWRQGRSIDVIGFIRNRSYRDQIRRDRAGERRWDLFTEIRRLGPRDAGLLARLQAGASAGRTERRAAGPAEGGEPEPAEGDRDALRYLRDPSVRHWIAETAYQDRPPEVCGQLVAHLLSGVSLGPSVVVTHIQVPSEHRAGMVGPLLAAALCDEAARIGAAEVVALVADPAEADHLRDLGFRRYPKRPFLLTLPG